MIDTNQRMITINSQGELGGINPAIKRHYELQIKALQNAPGRDADKLEQLLRIKQRQNDEAMHVEDTQRLVTEIEMLKVVLYLVCRNNDMHS
jgi:demethoxyubiquinone hydroxylase (CLK1/Coq7/Cat5 family)